MPTAPPPRQVNRGDLAVGIVLENVAMIRAAVHHMVPRTGEIRSRRARHVGLCRCQTLRVLHHNRSINAGRFAPTSRCTDGVRPGGSDTTTTPPLLPNERRDFRFGLLDAEHAIEAPAVGPHLLTGLPKFSCSAHPVRMVTMGSWIMRALVIALVGLVALSTDAWAQAEKCSNKDFCSGWRVVCHRTLPAGASPKGCTDRYQQCLTNGCLFFNQPRPRCKNNPEDLKLTLSCQPRR